MNDAGDCGVKELMCESKLIDLLNGSDYVPTYQDKDGDWMLVGDVPWGYFSTQTSNKFHYLAFIFYIINIYVLPLFFKTRMFVDSCKRLRIMKSSEAIGLGIVRFDCPFTQKSKEV